MKIAQGGRPWLSVQVVVAFIGTLVTVFSSGLLQMIALLVTLILWLLFFTLLVFFRDPYRTSGEGVVAVADGKIRSVVVSDDVDVGRSYQVSTFMNLYDVHVNRCCIDGTVKAITHYPGGYLPAFSKESKRNERICILLRTEIGMVKIVQIAGTLARRIVPYIQQGDKVKKGEKIGLIRLGSRVDVYLPQDKVSIQIQKRVRVKAGESCIAYVND